MIIIPQVSIMGAPIEAASITIDSPIGNTAASSTTYTFTAVPLGVAPKKPNRRWVVVVWTGGNINLNSITCDVNSGSQIYEVELTSPNGFVLRWHAASVEVPDGTSENVVLTFASAQQISFATAYVLRNIDCSTETDSAGAAGTADAQLLISCPAGGAIIAFGESGASSGSSLTSAQIRNVNTLESLGAGTNGNNIASGEVYATAQTNLDVDYLPVYVGTIVQSQAIALAFAPYF